MVDPRLRMQGEEVTPELIAEVATSKVYGWIQQLMQAGRRFDKLAIRKGPGGGSGAMEFGSVKEIELDGNGVDLHLQIEATRSS